VSKFTNTFRGKPVLAGDSNLQVLHGFMLGAEHAGLVTISTYDGREAVDFRRFYFDDAADAWKPSIKGLRIPPAESKDIAIALIRYAKEKSA